MKNPRLSLWIRQVDDKTSIIDIQGEVTSDAEDVFLRIFDQLVSHPIANILLNFSGMNFMNSSGIGLLITLLRKARSNDKSLFAYGLKDHFRQVFELTQLVSVIKIFRDEQEALSAVQGG
jgi:anti-anti-sigma factor